MTRYVLYTFFWFGATCMLGVFVGKFIKAGRSIESWNVLPFRRER